MPTGIAAEVAYEYLAMALETVHGTAVTPPTYYVPFTGMVKPMRKKARAKDSNGNLAEWSRSKTVTTESEWSGKGAVDPATGPAFLNIIVGAAAAPTTPTSGILARLWAFAPSMTTDTLKSATMYFGDPNVQIWQSTYCMGTDLTVSADASSDNAAEWTMKGFGRFPTRVAAPTLPAQIGGDMLMPSAMQLFIDTGSAIGTTEITGRFISTDWTIPTGVTKKRYAGGPTGGLNFTKHGRVARSAKAKIKVELDDYSIAALAEYQLWEADTLIKMRIRINGSLIETVAGPLSYYNYLQLDLYGPLDNLGFGEVSKSNRTMEFEVTSEYSAFAAAAGYDWQLSIQNNRTTL